MKTNFFILSHLESVLKDDDDNDDNDTETPDPGQPPLPGTKYLVRTSPHFDMGFGDFNFCSN